MSDQPLALFKESNFRLKRGSDLSKHDFPDLAADAPQHPIRAVGAEMVGWARAIRATKFAQAEAIILRTALPNSLRQYFKLKTVVGCRQNLVLASQRGSQLWEVSVVKSKTDAS